MSQVETRDGVVQPEVLIIADDGLVIIFVAVNRHFDRSGDVLESQKIYACNEMKQMAGDVTLDRMWKATRKEVLFSFILPFIPHLHKLSQSTMIYLRGGSDKPLRDGTRTVSYTHLTLPTKRIV